ncbi:hypothetical protein FRC01_006955, partial [Tulasnella sp. 417]
MPSSSSLSRAVRSSFLFAVFGLGAMSYLFPFSDLFTPSPFVGLGIPDLGDGEIPVRPRSAPLDCPLIQVWSSFSMAPDFPNTPFSPPGSSGAVPPGSLPGSSFPLAPDPSNTTFFPPGSSGAVPPGPFPSSSNTAGSSAYFTAFNATGAPGAPPFFPVSPFLQSLSSPYTSSSVHNSSSGPSRPSPLKSSTVPSSSPRHNPAPKRPSRSVPSAKPIDSSKARGVLNVKQVPGSTVFLHDLLLELITLAGLRTLLISHKVRGRSARRARDHWISLLRSHECTLDCVSLSYEVEHSVTDTAPASKSPSNDEVKSAVADLINKHLKTDRATPNKAKPQDKGLSEDSTTKQDVVEHSGATPNTTAAQASALAGEPQETTLTEDSTAKKDVAEQAGTAHVMTDVQPSALAGKPQEAASTEDSMGAGKPKDDNGAELQYSDDESDSATTAGAKGATMQTLVSDSDDESDNFSLSNPFPHSVPKLTGEFANTWGFSPFTTFKTMMLADVSDGPTIAMRRFCSDFKYGTIGPLKDRLIVDGIASVHVVPPLDTDLAVANKASEYYSIPPQ